jgi:hypothetical protein
MALTAGTPLCYAVSRLAPRVPRHEDEEQHG